MLNKNIIPLLLFCVACIALAVQFHAAPPLPHIVLNADAMYLPTLIADLFARGGRMADWYLTPAPYFFPDYPMFALAYLGGRDALAQIVLFGVLQLAVATVAIAWIARSGNRNLAPLTAMLVGAGLAWLALHAVEPYFYVLASAFHFGGFLMTLVFVALWLQYDQHGRRGHLFCMCAIAFLTALSDTLFIAQAMAPFLVTCALARRRDRPFARAALLAPLAVLAATILGSVSYRWVVTYRTRHGSVTGLAHLHQNAADLWQQLTTLITQIPVLGVVMIAWLVIGLAALVQTTLTGGFARLPRPLVLLLVFSMIAAGGNLASMLLLTKLVVTPRYLIAALCWPVIVMPILLAYWRPLWFGRAALGALAVLAAWLVAGSVATVQSAHSESMDYPAQSACIDRALAVTGARHGIAGYWDAKRIQSLSRRDLTIAQYLSDLTEQRWITSARYFRPTYDFAIITAANGMEYQLPADRLIASSGPPVLTAACGDRTVLVYGRDGLRMTPP